MNLNSLKTTINKLDKKSVGLFLWLNLNLMLATARYVLIRVGLETGTAREIILFVITCIPFAYLIIEWVRANEWVRAKKEILPNWKKILPNWMIVFILLYVSVVLAFFISLKCNPDLKEFYFREDYGIGHVFSLDGAIFAFLLFAMFDDPAKLRDAMTKSAYVMLFYLVVVVFLPAYMQGYWLDISPDGGTMKFSYSISFGYNMMFPFAVFFTTALKDHKPIHCVLALLCAMLIITNGSRGALVIMMAFFVLLIFIAIIDGKRISLKKISLKNISLKNFSLKTFPVKKIVLVVAIIATGIVLLVFGKSVIKSHGISSRSIEMLLNGSFSDSNGRNLIWKAVIEAIREGGLFGYGLFGDHPFVAPIHVAGYSHNLFLELLASFGIVGAMAIIYIAIDVVRLIILCKDENWRTIYVILFTCSCKLMLSLSLWYAWEFWAAAAVAYKYRTLMKKKSLLT